MNGPQKKELIRKAEEKTRPALSLWFSTVYEMEGGAVLRNTLLRFYKHSSPSCPSSRLDFLQKLSQWAVSLSLPLIHYSTPLYLVLSTKISAHLKLPTVFTASNPISNILPLSYFLSQQCLTGLSTSLSTSRCCQLLSCHISTIFHLLPICSSLSLPNSTMLVSFFRTAFWNFFSSLTCFHNGCCLFPHH